MRSSDPACPLCADLAFDVRFSGIANMYGVEALLRSKLWETDHTYLTAGPGSLAVGYLILAPKSHTVGLSRLPEDVQDEVECVVDVILNGPSPSENHRYVAFEHGAADALRRGAACIDHAHLHLLPVPDPEGMIAYLRRWYESEVVDHIKQIESIVKDSPYLLFRTADRSEVFIAPRAESQFLRKLAAKQLGIANKWDWRSNPMEANFRATTEFFHYSEQSKAIARCN